MDMFGDSSEDEQGEVAVAFPSELTGLMNTFFTALVKRRNRSKLPDELATGDLKVAAISKDGCGLQLYTDPFVQRLRAAKFEVHTTDTAEALTGMFDAVVYIDSDTSRTQCGISFYKHVVPGGFLFTISPTVAFDNGAAFPTASWTEDVETLGDVGGQAYRGSLYRKHNIRCNTQGALYWATLPDQLERETANTAEVTVCLSTLERRHCTLSDHSCKQACDALTNHGVCIIRGLFDQVSIAKTAELVLKDLDLAKASLLTRGIDLTKPGPGAPPINNYHELSMREAFRVDLRNGKHMKNLDSTDAGSTPQQNHYFRSNKSILRILETVMNPKYEEVPSSFRGGNWGRWNFGGAGPDAPPPPPIAGEMGAVVSLPGCLDQTIHADTAHLFDHIQLPAHYLNLFIPGVVGDLPDDEYMRVGQTAFIVGSHQLDVCARLMNTGESGEQEVERRMIRPHMDVGDVLLFDCRVLHFGLENKSLATNRPMLYVNYHHPSFRDPKNWNEAERLFVASEETNAV